MARGDMQVKQGFCPQCNVLTKCERNSTVWGLGDVIMILFTPGGWLILKFLWAELTNGWRCSRCGTKRTSAPSGLVPGGDPLASMPPPGAHIGMIAAPTNGAADATMLLATLDDMFRRGLIAQVEHSEKRVEILRSP